MKRKILSVMVAGLFLSMLIMNCDSNGKKKMEEQQKKEKQRIEEEQLKKEEERKKEQQKKIDTLLGKGAAAKADPDFVGSKFENRGKIIGDELELNFASDTNLVSAISPGVVIDSYPTAAYKVIDDTVPGNKKIIFDFTNYLTALSTVTQDDYMQLYKIAAEKELRRRGGMTEEEIKKVIEDSIQDILDEIKKHPSAFEDIRNTAIEQLKNPIMEGVLSADKNTITIKNFVYYGWGSTSEKGEKVFTRQ
ncbi:hypothetical protein FUT84_01335 [Treponema phagedenis]|uniref:hypothetical protein n=1 Tax=Treponema phagedenis TaxID=162 RepID=UPI0011E7CF4C|nr:hypothetical protein [Treponema phagedenis]QEJ99953.1 hypothetical protein FUT84_01335 [Treponema phagedenis]